MKIPLFITLLGLKKFAESSDPELKRSASGCIWELEQWKTQVKLYLCFNHVLRYRCQLLLGGGNQILDGVEYCAMMLAAILSGEFGFAELF